MQFWVVRRFCVVQVVRRDWNAHVCNGVNAEWSNVIPTTAVEVCSCLSPFVRDLCSTTAVALAAVVMVGAIRLPTEYPSRLMRALVVGKSLPVARSTPQGTCASQCWKGTGIFVGAARTERKSISGKPVNLNFGRRRRSERRPPLFSPCLEGGLATLVLMAALLCRLGDYVQASGLSC